jgi:very-short-patch-repair endonuclease
MNSNKHLFNTNELGKYRSILLKNLGFTVLRFENIREYQDPESVIKEIRKYQSEKQ